MQQTNKQNTILVAENIRSTFNLGGLFRLADAVGVTTIIGTGYTPQLTDRFGRNNEKLSKTALGAEKAVGYEHNSDSIAVLHKLQKTHIIIAIEQTPRAICYTNYQYKTDTSYVFVIGNEIDGIEERTLALSSTQVYIPMYGKKESLNLITAAAIVLYHARMNS